MTPADSNIIPFKLSRFAPSDKPIPRYRSDRGWVDLERSAPVEPWIKVIGGLIGWVVFAVAGFWIAGILAKVWGL